MLVVWSAGKEQLDQQKRKAYLKRWLNGLEQEQAKLNTGCYKKLAYVAQRIETL